MQILNEWGFDFPPVLRDKVDGFVPLDLYQDMVTVDVEHQVLHNNSALMMPRVDYYNMLLVKFSKDREFLQQTRLSKNVAGNVSRYNTLFSKSNNKECITGILISC